MIAHRIRPEAVIEEQSMLIERAARAAGPFLRQLQRRLLRSRLPGLVTEGRTVRFGGWLSRRRGTLAVWLETFPEVRCYVGADPVGAHLEVIAVTVVEPHLLRRWAASAIGEGAWWSMSMPRGFEDSQEMRSFLTLFDAAVQDTAQRLARRLQTRRDSLGDNNTELDQWL